MTVAIILVSIQNTFVDMNKSFLITKVTVCTFHSALCNIHVSSSDQICCMHKLSAQLLSDPYHLIFFLSTLRNYWMTDTSQSQAEPEVDSARGELKWWRTWWDACRWQGPGMVSSTAAIWSAGCMINFEIFDCRFGNSIGNFVTKSTLKS